ncbi:uncharacterized protein LOC129743245 [Uranotaenia lowii]|uniref:uncharacterized protein LOC129743245 n=1 Tax=Uranotaenia lowii TaxID=190385 RepID=UPI00247B15C2|nr:uncharacterized protein LOC129743245 [Uranotaenia lowii]
MNLWYGHGPGKTQKSERIGGFQSSLRKPSNRPSSQVSSLVFSGESNDLIRAFPGTGYGLSYDHPRTNRCYECHSIKITRLSVPRAYILDDYHRQNSEGGQMEASSGHSSESNELFHPPHAGHGRAIYESDGPPDGEPRTSAATRRHPHHHDGRGHHLVLDCEYDIDPAEKGFVLKWLFNGKMIYQWIPPRRPSFNFSEIRHQVNRSFTVNNEALHKHRALALVRPLKNFTGDYSCRVSTFEGQETRTSRMTVIVPEKDFKLKYYTTNISNLVTVICSVYGIYPAPSLSLWVNEYQLENVTVNVLLTQAELFDSSISIQLVLYESIRPDDVIKCMVGINRTDYSVTKETVFVDVNAPVLENNSILDSTSSTVDSIRLPVSSTTESYQTSSTSTMNNEVDDPPTPAYTISTASSMATVTISTEQPWKERKMQQHPGIQHHPPGPPQQPGIVRLRPTSGRVLTVVQQASNGDSDEVTNVLDFKEVLFNDNLLYSSRNGAAATVLRTFPILRWCVPSWLLASFITICAHILLRKSSVANLLNVIVDSSL